MAPLATGGVIVLTPPSATLACRSEFVQPHELFGPATLAITKQSPDACAVELLRPLRADVLYSLSLPLANPILTPQPNVWFLLALSRGSRSDVDACSHSVGEGPGYEVAGEFYVFEMLAKSAVPEQFTPVAVRFKLRTALPGERSVESGPQPPEPAVRFRIAVFDGESLTTVKAFDPRRCLLDMLEGSVIVDAMPGMDVITPDDCLVTNEGAVVEFFLDSGLQSRRDYIIWAWMHNPATGDTERTYAASTVVVGGNVVHRTSVRPQPLLGVKATVTPGSYVEGERHRAFVAVSSGRAIIGQRGAVEVTLPPGFEGSCGADDFRPRPSLPTTARCRSHTSSSTGGKPSRIVVYWRTLLGHNRLLPPYEFSFALVNANMGTMSSELQTPGGWHVRLYEGENSEFPVDGSPEDGGVAAFEICSSLRMTMKREDARVVSIVFRAGRDLEEGFENFVRVELLTSARLPAALGCPDTSIWQRRQNLAGGQHLADSALGLPKYTVCVRGPQERDPLPYLTSALQRRSAVLFLLPFARFRSVEPYGLEVIVERSDDMPEIDLSPSEAAAERIALYLESGGVRLAGASALLGPKPVPGNGDAADGPEAVEVAREEAGAVADGGGVSG